MLRRIADRRSRWMTILLGIGLCSQALALEAQTQAVPRWTLAEALDKAFARSPELRARQAEMEVVASSLVGARIYPYNPELELEVADRSSPGGSSTDRGFSLSQELEIAGQRRKRITVASKKSAAAEAIFRRDGRLLAFRVETAFVQAIRARELLAVAEIDAALARDMLDFSKRRLERGATTQIEVNLAQASAGRVERGVQRARAAYASARSRLAEVTGLNPAVQPEPLGELALPRTESQSLENLLKLAEKNRGDLASAVSREQAAEASIRLAVAEARPHLTVGVFSQREEATDEIFGATLGFSLPLFDRNQGRVAQSRAVRDLLRYEREALRLAIGQEILEALNDLQAAGASAEYLRDQVLSTLEDNVELLQRSFAAGRIGATEVVTLRREFVASRLEYIEVLADAWLAGVKLDLATGQLTTGEELK